MILSIVMPVFNERATLATIIQRVMAVNIDCEKELVIVDDASTDGTRELLQSMQAERRPGMKIILHEDNQGKGAAIRTGLQHTTGEVVLIQDADLEYDPADYPRLLDPFFKGQADVVYGNRFHGGVHRVLYFWHALGNQVLTFLSNLLTNLNLSDMEVGYKVFRADVLKQIRLRSNRFGFEPEVTAKVAKMGCRIYEVPIAYHGRTYAEGKKITWKDGVAALWCLIRYRFFD
jgi:glycosyltransferase involved in cell wall biosynthesis